MEGITANEIIKIQHRAARRGVLIGFMAGLTTAVIVNMYNELARERNKNWGKGD